MLDLQVCPHSLRKTALMSCPKNRVRDLLLKCFIMNSASLNRHKHIRTQDTLQPEEIGPINCAAHWFCGLFCKIYVCAPRRNWVLLSLVLLKRFLICVAVLPLTLMRTKQDKHTVNSSSWNCVSSFESDSYSILWNFRSQIKTNKQYKNGWN